MCKWVKESMKKGRILKSRQLNNKGMSLVEVLVAITILAIVTGPILQTFVSSMRYNAKAKEQQRITTVAQSVMEGFKAYDIEELCEQFNGVVPFQVIANASGGVSEINPGDGDDNYTFRLEDVSFEGTFFYDAEVQVTPRVPGAPDAFDGVETDMLVSVDDMNAYKDAVYKQDVLQDEKAYDEILKDFLNNKLQPLDKMYIYELSHIDRSKISVKKYTTVTITGSDSTNHQVQVQTEYKYSVTNYPYYDELGNENYINFSDEVCAAASSTTMIYDSTATASAGAMLENVYLYYYPAYNTGSAPVALAEDNITITNNADTTKNVYLIKQKFPESKISNISLVTCESSYTPTVVAGDRVQLYYNLDKNLASEGSPVGAVSLSASLTPQTEFVTTGSKVLLYNVTVSIYNPADNFTGTPLLTLDGTMNDQ